MFNLFTNNFNKKINLFSCYSHYKYYKNVFINLQYTIKLYSIMDANVENTNKDIKKQIPEKTEKPKDNKEIKVHDDSKANFGKALKGAEMGKVVTRFPPEPSGYLHVGHVKAAMLNYHLAKMWNGKMILRYDDTNTKKEKEEFAESIKEDLKTLEIIPDSITHTSDHFELLMEMMTKMIKDDKAYCDNIPQEEVNKYYKVYRCKKIEWMV